MSTESYISIACAIFPLAVALGVRAWRWFRAWRARRRIARNRFGGVVINAPRPRRGPY